MCGISGYLGPKKYLPGKGKIKSLLQSMKRRGPDGHGFFIKNTRHMSMLFAHTRLAIIDLQK